MRSAVIVFPGSNRDHDVMDAIEYVAGIRPIAIWHQETDIPSVDLVVLPGGFSYGDYLRSGAIAARSPVMREVIKRANMGISILGICNGFQTLTEAGLLPGALMRNQHLTFVCREVMLEVVNTHTRFTNAYKAGSIITCPIAHHDGNYYADAKTLAQLEEQERIAFRYAETTNPNGSCHDIAGILNETGNVLGMMPHPENLVLPHQGTDGRGLFQSLMNTLAIA